jgi:hypothetical protein
MSFFKENGTSNRVEFKAGVNLTPYNGFSFYKIEYQGDYPDYLLKAYQRMSELDNETPRVKFKEKRKNNKNSSSP